MRQLRAQHRERRPEVLAPLAIMPAVEGVAADRATGIGPAQRRGTSRGATRSRIERPAVERLAGLAGLDLPPLATVPADCTTGNGPAHRGASRGARHVGGIERLAGKRLARLDLGAARHLGRIQWPRGRAPQLTIWLDRHQSTPIALLCDISRHTRTVTTS
jgi:hypothetical protein